MLEDWMRAQQHVWNVALSLLIRHRSFSAYCKDDKAYYPCCPVRWDFRYVPNEEGNGYASIPVSRCAYFDRDKNRISFCSIPQRYQDPEIKSRHKFSLVPWFAFATLDDRQAPGGFNLYSDLIRSAPAKMMQGTIEILHTSWQEHEKGKRKMPRFKGKKNPLVTLRSSAHLNIKGDNHILLSQKMGMMRCKGIGKRTKHLPKICQGFGITKKASGYYLNLVVKVSPSQKIEYPDVMVGVDPGVVYATTTDYGRQIESPRFLRQQIKRLRREQRRFARMQKGGANREKQRQKIAKLHEKIVRQRIAFWHKETTFLSRKFGAIAVEDNNFANMGRRAKPKPREDGKGFLPNGGKAKSGLNRSLRDVGAARLKTFLQAKAAAMGNEVKLVKSHYNSQTCSRCGSVDKDNRKTQSEFVCVNCGFSENADINAATNVLLQVVEWEGIYHRFGTELSNPEPGRKSKKPASVDRSLSNVSSQQEGDKTPSPEITGDLTPKGEPFTKPKRGRKTRPRRQKRENLSQLAIPGLSI